MQIVVSSYFYSFLCFGEQELTKDDTIIIDLNSIGITTAVIVKKVKEIVALTARERPIPIIQHADKVKEYLRSVEKTIQMQDLILQMEDKAKDVKAREQFRKLSLQDPQFADIFKAYEQLEKEVNQQE